MPLNLSRETIDKVAAALAPAYAAKQDYSRYGDEPNLRAAIQEQILHGEENRIRHVLELKSQLDFAGRLNPQSGQGGSTGLADQFLPNPGEWWVGVCVDRVPIRVFFASEPYLAAAKPANPWRWQCCVEVMTENPSRYNWPFTTVTDALRYGIVNPSGE